MACIFWAFRGVQWMALWTTIRHANYLWVLPYVAILLVIHLCRTLRWGHLLAGLENVPFRATRTPT